MGNNDSFTLLLTGDSMITRRASRVDDRQAVGLIERIRGADVAFTNLEVLPNDFQGYPVQDSGGDHMAARAWVLDELLAMGFDLFATAHNHALDYGVEGLLATMARLDERGVSYAGIGRNLGEARMPAFYDTPRGSVALLSCSSTFGRGQQAGEQRPDLQGRPGLNPLRTTTTYVVSPAELAAIQSIAERLGLERQRQERLRLGFAFPPDDPDVFPLGELRFRAGDEPAITRAIDARDMEAMAAWVRDARLRAAWVVVSLHAHEQGATKEEPADFIGIFARRMIDDGADLVVGHGPHLLRGMELYRGKPIFYSLGNFIDQHDLIDRHPADAYERFRVDPALTHGHVAAGRDGGGFATDSRYWRTVVPVCRYVGQDLAEIEILPVALGFGQPMHARGQPRLAEGDEAAQILRDFARLSVPFGTRIEIDGERGFVSLAG